MQQVDATYTALISQPHRVDTKLEVWDKDGVSLVHTFYEDEISNLSTQKSLFASNNPSVGGTVSAEIDCELYNPNEHEIPRMAMLRPYVRLNNGSQQSGWIPKGVFWVDTRKEDYATYKVQIHGYDAMLKGEQLFEQGTTVIDWPRTDIQVLNGCVINDRVYEGVAQKIGVTIQDESLAMIDKGYMVQFPGTAQTSNGDQMSVRGAAMTVREVLSAIGAMYCGNWTIDEDGTMRFVQLGVGR